MKRVYIKCIIHSLPHLPPSHFSSVFKLFPNFFLPAPPPPRAVTVPPGARYTLALSYFLLIDASTACNISRSGVKIHADF